MVDLSRRNFMRAKHVSTPPAIRLPWTVDEKLFTQGCTQCGDCMDACEENIIVKGDGGFPEINFFAGECTFCQQCVKACKEPLFKPLDAVPWQLTIEIEASCLAKNQVHCQVCQDSCESDAISFKYLHASVPQPEITLLDCTGCGACVAICPESAIKLSTTLLGAEHE
jgi:ferredoxin-type protein NapF|tara:strand:- start:1800 stop:2303 length:504 start_codon:yes stop_codon:yes gene_type:complete